MDKQEPHVLDSKWILFSCPNQYNLLYTKYMGIMEMSDILSSYATIKLSDIEKIWIEFGAMEWQRGRDACLCASF